MSCRCPTTPYLFRPGRVPGTREIVVHPNYIVVYQVIVDAIEIVSAVHTARNYKSTPNTVAATTFMLLHSAPTEPSGGSSSDMKR